MAKIWQEFYCTKSGGGCGGYFMVKLNMALDHTVEVVCPNCKHEHRRSIKEGVILEDGRYSGNVTEKIVPPKSAYSKEPKTIHMKEHKTSSNERDGAVVKKKEDLVRDQTMWQRWCERFGGGYDAAQE